MNIYTNQKGVTVTLNCICGNNVPKKLKPYKCVGPKTVTITCKCGFSGKVSFDVKEPVMD